MKKLLLLIISVSMLNVACDNTDKAANKAVTPAVTTPPVAEPVVVEKPAVVVEETKPAEPVPATAAPAVATAESIYNRTCVGCHKTGAANAPKVGDATAWAPRIAKGMDTLYQSALKGVPGTAMMPKGTCGACSEEEIKSVVEYMVSQSK